MARRKTIAPQGARPPAAASTKAPDRILLAQQTSEFHGPIPHPDHLARYNDIVPGAAERILCMAEEDASHQRYMERAALEGAVDHAARGQRYGLGIGLAGLAASVVIAIYGHEWAASIIGGSTVLGLVTVFVVGRAAQAKTKADA